MKFVLIIIVILSVFYSISFSQSNFNFGVKTGIVSTKYELKYIFERQPDLILYNDTRIGPTVSFFLRYLFNDHFNIESEILYLQKGGEEKFYNTTIDYPEGTGDYLIHDIHFDYLQFHTSIRPKTTLSNVELYGLAGFSINYLLQVRNAFQDIDDFNRINFAYSLGAGIEFDNIINKPIFFEFMLNSDFTKTYDESDFKFISYLFRIGFYI